MSRFAASPRIRIAPATPRAALVVVPLTLALLVLLATPVARAKTAPHPPRRPSLPGHLAPPGYTIDSLDAVAKRPVWEEAEDGSFTYSIRRVFSDSTEARILAIAEAVYPPRDALIGIAARGYYEMGHDTSGVPLWWCQGIGCNRIPYAVTAGTMEHYLALTKRFREHNFWETGMGGGLFWTDLIYHARVSATPSFTYRDREYQNVYVVQIVFAWSFDDGTFVPVIETQRTVVLSQRGDVLAVQGDGAADQDVRLSEHRGIGRVDHVFR